MTPAFDHDLHVHSQLSLCSSDPEQTPEAILRYALRNGLRDICLTDHLWDGPGAEGHGFYGGQDLAHVRRALPLPQAEGVRFHFGCEIEMRWDGALGLRPEHFDAFEFVIVPTTHLHMRDFTIRSQDWADLDRRRELYVARMDHLFSLPLPFRKIGLAHPTCPLLAPAAFEDHLALLDGIPEATWRRLWAKAAAVGIGVELNVPVERYATEADRARMLRPYRFAKEAGCRFYFGRDAHHPSDFDGAAAAFRYLAEALDLREEDLFRPFGPPAR